MSELMSL